MSAADTCTHPNFNVEANVQRMSKEELGPVKWFRALIQISCSACGLDFKFMGAPLGMSHSRPTMAVDALTIHVPMQPNDGSKFEAPEIDGYALVRKEKGSK